MRAREQGSSMSRSGVGPRRTTAMALGVVAVLALAGCGDDKAEPRQSSRPVGRSASASASTGADEGATPDGQTPEIEVLGTGAQPRRVLELDLVEGHVEDGTMRMTVTTSADVMSTPPVKVPMVMPVRTTVTDVTGDRATVESQYGEVSVPRSSGLDEASRQQLLESMQLLDGTTIRVVYDRSARTLLSEVEYGDKGGSEVLERMLDDFAAQSSNLSVLMPEQAVGVGARWQATSSITVGGITSDVVATYELTGLADDGYTVRLTSRQTPRRGPVATGGEIIGGGTDVTGTTEVRHGMVGPFHAIGTGHGTVTMEVGGQRVRTTFDMTMDVSTR